MIWDKFLVIDSLTTKYTYTSLSSKFYTYLYTVPNLVITDLLSPRQLEFPLADAIPREISEPITTKVSPPSTFWCDSLISKLMAHFCENTGAFV